MKKYLLRRLGVAHDVGGSKPSLLACIEAVLEQTDVLMDDVVSGMQTATSPANSKGLHAARNVQRRAVVDALVLQQAALQKAFHQALRAAVYGGEGAHKASPARVRFDDFQFLEEDQIDANIELAMSEQEVLLAVENILPVLNGLVSSLMGWTRVHAHLNPLRPENFVYALREAFSDCIPSDEARADVMGLAAGLMGTVLAQLYREVVDWLRAQGVESVTVTPLGGNYGATATPAQNSVTRTLLTLDKLRRLLSGELDPRGTAVGSKDFTHTIPASMEALEDLKLVEPMMRRLAERARQAAPAPMGPMGAMVDGSKAGNTASEALGGKALGRQLGEEVVRLMLDNLQQDRRMLPGVRRSLQAMEPVLLRLSAADPRFFSDKKHPARHFLDKITSRSLAFTSEDELGYAQFLQALHGAVQILVAGPGDGPAFLAVLGRMQTQWAHDEQQLRQRAEEAARSLLHAEQRHMLAQRLAQEFMERLDDKPLPDLVLNFLRGPWAQVVAESQLRGAEDAQEHEAYISLVDDLAWSVQLRLVRRNRARLVDMVPHMLVKLRQGLQRIHYPSEAITAFFNGLISIHEQAFDSGRASAAEPAEPPPEQALAALRSDDLWLADNEAADSGFVRESDSLLPLVPDAPEIPEPMPADAWSADTLGTGAWVDLALDGAWVRAQLTWASPHRTLFMFTSSGGQAHSMSRRTMERLRTLEQIRLVSDGHVMDNALDAVAQTALRNHLGNGGSAA